MVSQKNYEADLVKGFEDVSLKRKLKEGDEKGSNSIRRKRLCNHDKALKNMDPNIPFELGRANQRN